MFTLAFCSAVEFSSLLFLLKNSFQDFFFRATPFVVCVSAFVFDTFDCLSYSSLLAMAIPEYT